MSGRTSLPDKPYIFGFNSGRLVVVVCAVLVLMALSIMMGIRIEKYQRPNEALAPETTRSAPAPVTAEPAQQLPEAEPSPAPAVPSSASPTAPAPAAHEEKPATASAAPAPAPEAPMQAVPTPTAQRKTPAAVPQKPKVAEPPPTPKPQPKPVTAPAPKPEPKPVAAAPAPKPEPKPVAAAPTPKPEPKPVAAAPAPKPEPKPASATPTPKPEPKPVAAAPAPKLAVPPAKKEIPKTQYAIQVSASKDKSMAVSEAEILKQKGFPSYVEETAGASKLYRVKVGPFSTEAEANKVKSQLVKDSRFAGAYIRPLGSR